MSSITFEEYLIFHREFLSKFYFEALYMGNISRDTVMMTFYSIKDSLQTDDRIQQKQHLIQLRNIKLKSEVSLLYGSTNLKQKEKSDAILLMYELGMGFEYY